MRAIKYLMVDVRRVKKLLAFMAFFGIISYMLIRGNESSLMGFGYMLFAASMMYVGVFNMEQKNDTGFVNMLPGSDRERITGRFLTGGVFLLGGSLMATLSAVILNVQGIAQINHLLEKNIFFGGIGLGYMSVQNILFYVVGKGNSAQAIASIRIIPTMLLWFIGTIFVAMYEDADFVKKLAWLTDNLLLVSIVVFMIGIGLSIAGIFISTKIVSKKDYA